MAEAEHWLHVDVLERDEAEALATASFTVEHDSCVYDLSELREELAHALAGHTTRETADEKLCRTLML